MRGRAAFAYRASSVDTIACRASVDSTLLPAVMDQIFVDNRDFYRATRMHSADYAVARCPSVCPSVCHTPVLSVNGYTYPQNLLPSGSPTILVFPYQTGWQYSEGDPPNGGAECKGV